MPRATSHRGELAQSCCCMGLGYHIEAHTPVSDLQAPILPLRSVGYPPARSVTMASPTLSLLWLAAQSHRDALRPGNHHHSTRFQDPGMWRRRYFLHACASEIGLSGSRAFTNHTGMKIPPVCLRGEGGQIRCVNNSFSSVRYLLLRQKNNNGESKITVARYLG